MLKTNICRNPDSVELCLLSFVMIISKAVAGNDARGIFDGISQNTELLEKESETDGDYFA